MDVSRAKRILDSTFNDSFDMDNFESFLIELFDKSNIHFSKRDIIVKKGFKKYIKSILSMGTYIDEFREQLGLYVVELYDGSYRDRARAIQRNVIAQELKKTNKNQALVAFYEESNPDDWRFSFIKIDFEFTSEGLKEKLRSSRRHSFLVGLNESNYTCEKQFLNLLISEDKVSIDDIEDAFGIENVTQEFFEQYKKLYLDLKNSLDDILLNDKKVKDEFTKKNIDTSDFAKKLMGQLVFLYFLQKKGWLGLEESEDWGYGPKKFLRNLFDKEYLDYSNFFNDILEPLFYKGFCEPVRDYHYSEFGFKVPFLNGGLFEPMNDYDWRNTDINLDNGIFERILDVFDLFNFTIKEDEPLEKEVAVDPEMLGKVFENLLENADRKSKGAFYTPRSIVHFMCQESLISYLNTNSNVSENDLREFIEKGDIAIDSIIRNHEEIKAHHPNPSRIKLPNSINENSEMLESLLKNVKVIDPAVGSGAFPVGMLNEILKARQILLLLNNVDDFNVYDLKREIIENSLYCVDLEPSATDITKLRFWLSLVVDEDDIDNIRPLPNLDNHVVSGNSLVDEFEGVKLFNNQLIDSKVAQTTLAMKGSEIEFQKLEKKKQEYFNEKSPLDKLKLKEEINNIKWNFINESLKESGNGSLWEDVNNYKNNNSKPFFIWELEFSEIFDGDNSGFDIAIGNPPYVKEATSKDAFDGVRNSPYYQGKMDLWYLFGCKALDLVKEQGTVSFIATNNWITSAGASKFRNKVNNEAKFKFFIDFGNYKVFNTASIQTMIYLMQKDSFENEYVLNYSKLFDDKVSKDFLETFLYSSVSQEKFVKFSAEFNREENKDNYFNFIDTEISNVLDKISSKENLKFLFSNELSQGIVSPQENLNKKNAEILGYDIGVGIFVLNDDELNRLHLNKTEYNQIKPFFNTDNIFRYYVDPNNKKWIIYNKSDINKNISKFPNIKKHLDKFEEINTSSNKPYGLHRARKEEIFTSEKIIVTRKCAMPTFSYADFDAYVSQTFMIINSKRFNLKFLTGLLNSKLIQFWLKYKGKMQGNNYQLDKEPLLKIPIISEIDAAIENKIIENVENILKEYAINEIDNLDIENYENKINDLVFKLYDLNEEEINIIENNI